MIYLLHGEDDFSLYEALASIKDEVQPPDLRDVNTTTLDASEIRFDQLAATCDTVPFLAEKRLVVVEGLLSRFERRRPSQGRTRATPEESSPALDQWKEMPEYLSRVPETTDLVFVDGRLSATNSMLKAIQPHVKARAFPRPNPGQLREWIRNRAAAEGIDIDPRAVDTLAQTMGADIRAVAMELQKLSLYRPNEPISHDDVLEMVSYTKESNIFAAVDAMIEGRSEVAIGLVRQLLQSGSPPAYVLVMMARQVRLLLLAKELKARKVPAAEQGRRLGLTGYPLRKTLKQEKMFTARRLVEIHRSLLEADLSMKTSGVGDELILDVLIAEVSSVSGVRGKAATRGYRR